MFVGHYSVAFAARTERNKIPLWVLFVAVQLLDFLWAPFVLLGIEKVRIVPGITATSPLDLYYMPYTHSLIGALIWSVSKTKRHHLSLAEDRHRRFRRVPDPRSDADHVRKPAAFFGPCRRNYRADFLHAVRRSCVLARETTANTGSLTLHQVVENVQPAFAGLRARQALNAPASNSEGAD